MKRLVTGVARYQVIALALLLSLALQGCEVGGQMAATAIGKIIDNSITGDWRSNYEKWCVPEPVTEDARVYCSWGKPRAKPTAPAPSASTEGTTAAVP